MLNIFYECSGLTSVTIGNSVTSIGSSAFSGCSSLKSVTIPNSVTSIRDYTFSGCSGLTSVTIPNSVTSIGSSAFENCSGLTSLTIPNSVTSIGNYAFTGCSGLTSVNIQDIAAWCKISFGSNPYEPFGSNPLGWAHHLYLNGEEIRDLVIPNSVRSISKYAFYGCSGLTSVTIGNSVTYIGSSAFKYCSGLTSVTILCPKVGSWFSGMTSIKEVVIGKGVESIDDGAFSGCSGLTSVISLNTTPPKISKSTFSDETYKSATLKVPVGCKNIYWLHPYWENFTKIEEIDLSAKQAEAQEAYTKAQDVYLSYLFYYQDQRPKFYQQVLDEYNENSKVARVLLDDIYSVKKEVSFSNMSTEDKASFNKTLDELYYFVSNLEKENEKNEPPKGFHADYYEYISAYYERLNQYKERIDAAQTNAELDAIISEMNADANQTETEIRKDYDELINIESVIVRISRDLAALRAQLETIIVEIDAIEFLQKKEDAIAIYNDAVSVYDSYVYYYKGDGQTFYQTTIDKQSDNQKYIGDIFADIERLKKQISDSSMSDDEKAFYNKTLDEIENAVYALAKENDSGCYIYFNDCVQEYYDSFSDYYSRLEQYKERIDAATTNAELDAIIAEIDADATIMTYYMYSVISDYNEMVGESQKLTKIGEELSKYQTKLKEIAKDIEASISGIEQVLLSDSDVIVVSLRGERMKMKSSQIRALPKGIYIVNGRKFVVK